jgi:hypothetical protein
MPNEFWKPVEITPDIVVYETPTYLVVVTPTLWREQARKDTDRNLAEYSLVNKVYGCVEAGSNNLSSAIITAKSLQMTLDEVTKEEKVSANTLRIVPKNNPE